MTEAASFDLIPTDALTNILLQRNEDESSQEAFNENFEELGYDSVNFFDALSDMFYYELIFGSLTIFVCITKVIHDRVNRKTKAPLS